MSYAELSYILEEEVIVYHRRMCYILYQTKELSNAIDDGILYCTRRAFYAIQEDSILYLGRKKYTVV